MSNQLRRAGVIGWPIAHSRSPLIHRHWLQHYGLQGCYEAVGLQPEAAGHFFRHFKESGYIGANITIPYKETVMPYLDRIDEAARLIGAVNTIWLEDTALCGTNTDWLGFLGNLDAGAHGWDEAKSAEKTALVLGAGGAARGIIHALMQRGFDRLYVANRTMARAQEMQNNFGPVVHPVPFDQAENHVGAVQLIVNTTSLGMGANPPLNLSLEACSHHCLITDIVYTPLETPLLTQAAARGLRFVDGLGMLLHQAAPGFARWFGLQPVVDEALRALGLADMERSI